MIFGTLVIPGVEKIQRVQTRTLSAKPLPGREFQYLRDRGGLGAAFTVNGWIDGAQYPLQQTKAAIASLADGTARTLDFQYSDLAYLQSVLRYQSTPTWTDDTAASQGSAGSPFTSLAAATDYLYLGHHEIWNLLKVVLGAAGSCTGLAWQYSQGSSLWNTLSVTDGTSNLSRNGNITFTPPSDWKPDTVNSVSNKFWLRVSASAVTIPATIALLQINIVWNCLMSDPQFTGDISRPYDSEDYQLTFTQQVNP